MGRSTAASWRRPRSSRSRPSTCSTSKSRRTCRFASFLPMDLERLVSALEPVEVLGRPSGPVRDLAYDARAVTPGALFFAVPGEHADGHDHAPEAVERGAVALVVERGLDVQVPQILVADSRAAMAPAADV